VSFDNVSFAKSIFEYSGYKGVPIVGSVTYLPFRSHIFDKVLLSSVLQHIQNPIMVLEEINRVLKVGGVFVINVPSDRPYLYLPSLFREKYLHIERRLFWRIFRMYHKWSTKNMKKMLGKTGFGVVSLEYSPKYVAAFIYEISLLFTIMNLPQRVVKRLLFVATPITYSLSKLDYLLPRKMRGSEFIMKAEKSSFA
jgi:SAM-dependent methyltransferase